MPDFAKRMEYMAGSAEIIRGLFGAMNDPETISFGGGAPATDALPVEEIREIADDILRRESRGAEALQYGPDCPVLAGGVHGLEQEDNAFLLIGIKLILQLINQNIVLRQALLGFFPVLAQCFVIGGRLGNVELLTAVISVVLEHISSPLRCFHYKACHGGRHMCFPAIIPAGLWSPGSSAGLRPV